MKKHIYTLVFFLYSLMLSAAPGDDCSTAILVSSNGCSAVGAYNNTGIVGTLSPPACFGAGNNNGMWFKFIASGPVVNITVNGGTLASPMVGLFSSTGACVSPFTELGCSNPGGATATLPYSALVPGNTYYIYVDGANNNVGTFQLCLTSPTQPANDDPCNAITLPTSNFCSGANAYTNVGATGETLTSVSIPGCFDNPGTWNSVWYKFTAVGTTAVVTINGSLVRPQVAIIELTGACNGTSYNVSGCVQAASGTTTTLTIANAVPGNTYYIVVDGFSTNTGAFEICLNNYNPSSTVINDQCSNATILCPGNRYFATTAGATPLNDPAVNQWSCNGVVDNTVWFKFTTTNPVQPISFAINGVCTGDALQFEVFRKTSTGDPCTTTNQWSSVGCNNTINPSGSAALNIAAASLLPSTDYYIVVDNWPNRSCNFDFTITGNQGANAAADQTVCANAAPFTLPGFSPAGGTWSGPGVTAAGVFNPAAAGIGTHLLFYTYGPCTDTKTVKVTGPTVNVSNSVSVCPGSCTTLLGDATQPQVIVTNPSFSNTNDFAIPDNNTTGITSSVTVSGLTGTSSLQSVCLNINHTFDGDLDIVLRCPNGTTLELATDVGGGGDNYTNTCFNLTSAVNITSGTAPFNAATGYAPEGGSLNTLSGCSANGTWALIVKDDAGGDTGTLLDWTLNFNNTVINTIPATSFTWTPTTAMTGGATLSPTVCPTSTTVYSLTATDANGCTATDATTVTVTPLTITVTPTQNICAGTSTTLTAGGATSYTWSPATGLSSTSGAAVVASPTVNTTYTVVGAQGACTNTQVVVVNVSTPTLSVVTPSFCVGSSGALSASGANTYTWSPSTGLSSANGATVTANPTVTSTYTVSGTLANGCVGTQTAVVTVNPKPAAAVTFTNPTCGLSNGVIFISNTSPASPPQTVTSYTSSLGSVSGQTVTGLAASSPVITLTNNFGCTFTISPTLTNTPGPTDFSLTPQNTTCGNTNGSLTFTTPVTGGTAPYTYSVNGVAATSPTTGLGVGTYSVTIKDFNGCVFTKTTSITNIPGPTAILGNSTPAGCSLSNGSYTVTGVTGGTSTYSYSIDNGAYATTNTFAGLASGNHTISVVDANACTYSTTVNIGQLTGPTAASISTSLATCGSANGSATVTSVTGGTPTYSYSFNGGATFSASNSTTGLLAGSYTVIVKDVNSCTVSATYNINNSGSPTATVTGFTNPLCAVGSNTATGSFSISASGGSGAPFTYTLTSPVITNATGIFTGLPAGTYNVNIKDAAGCATTASVTLTNPTPVAITSTASPANCFGTPTGSIAVSGSGGTATYSYNINGGPYQASSSFTGQLANIYTMGISDSNGCLATQTIQVTQPTALTINVSSQNANCTFANGVATATVAGGTPTYTYSWTGGGGNAATSNSVVAGNYTVTATDSKGCTISGSVTVGVTPGGTAVITNSTNITCFNANNGSLTAGMTGAATAPFTYLWSPTSQTVATATGLAPGTYTCTITDFYGCVSTTSATLTQPTPLSLIMSSNNAKCFATATGTVSASGSGGTIPYSYLWPTLSSTLSTVSNVVAGNYSCTVTDANNCSVTQTITVTEPTAITLSSTVTPANCGLPNGSATVSASGGTPIYSYTWSTGATGNSISNAGAGTYTINVQDNNGCSQTLAATITNASGPSISISTFSNVSCFGGNNGTATALATSGTPTYTFTWSNGQVTPTATNLMAGVHTVTVTDQAGCKASTSVNITEPTALTVTITPSNPKCFGSTNGYGIAAAFGGTPTYTYTWSDGGTASTSNQLGAGSYGLNVTDANGCVVTATMGLVNPPAMAASITSSNVTCFSACNGMAVGSATNNVGIVNYQWIGGPSPITSQTVTNLCAGTYTLIATDQNSCTASNQVIITEPAALTASISSSGSVTCNGGSNGFAVVSANGGTPGYNYSWSGSAASNGNSANANNLFAGTYVVTIIDTKSCTVNTNVTISEPLPLTTTLTTTDPKCNSNCDGTGNIAFSGGAGATTFLWQPGLQTGNVVNNLCAGNHTVTITSNGSCIQTLTLSLIDPLPLTAVVSSTNSNCGQNNGRVCATVSGGTGVLTYNWSNGPTTLCNNSVLAGAYTFTVTDANLCTETASGLVNDIAGPVVTVLSSTNVTCFGGSDGAVTTTITGGVNPINISWSPTSPIVTVQNPTGLIANLYNITVTDAAGCIGTASVNITEPTQVVSAITSFTDVTCAGLTNGGATIVANGGTSNYTYSWTPSAQISSVLTGVGAGTYTCIVSDDNGCSSTKTVVISEPAPLVMTNSLVTNVLCNGGSNGQISTTVQGGTPGYTYSWTPAQAANSGVVGGLTAGSYNLVVTDTKTCSITKNFIVTEPAALTSTYASITAKCGLANGSASVNVTGGTQTASSPFYNMVWNTTPIQTGSVAINLAPGSLWNCTIIDLNGCSITQTTNIGSAPSPTITNKTVTQPLCFGQANGSIVVDHISGTPNYQIAWSSPISQTITTSSLSNTLTGIGTGVYTFSVIDSYGCVTSDFVNVGSPAPVTLSVSPTQSICFGQTAQIYAQAGGGTGAYTYSWTPSTLTGSGPHTVNPTTSTLYSVTVADANSCSPPIKVITVAVTPSLSISGLTITKCEGETITISPTITSPGKGAPYDFVWSNGVTHTAVASSSITVTTSTPSPNNYTVTIDDKCTVPTGSTVISINVNPLPVISFTADVLKGCSPLTVNLTGTSSGTSDVFTWQEQGLTGNPKEITFADTGKHTISLTVTNTLTGCAATLTKVDYIEVYPLPVASFYADPIKTSILDPNINFYNTSTGAVSYFWDFGNTAAIGSTNNSTLVNPKHEYGYVGQYNVHLVATSNKGCKDTAMVRVEIEPDFALYIPNTFTPDGNGLNDYFQPFGVGIDEDRYILDIFDRWGENIFTSKEFRKGWDGTAKGGSTSVQQGVYVYKIQVYDLMGKKHSFVGHVTLIRQSQQ